MTTEMAVPRGQRQTWLGSALGSLATAGPVVILAMIVIAAIAAPLITPYDPIKADLAHPLQPPAWVEGGDSAHPLGTDRFGRDVLSRLLYGARASLSVAALALFVAMTVGTTVGLIAGYGGGTTGAFLMRIVDMMLSLPVLLIALGAAVALGPSFAVLIFVIGFLIWPRIARLVRGEAMVLRQKEFVRYSRAVGVPSRSIVLRHVFPNVLPTILVAASLEIGHVILIEASLSFLGAGLPPPAPSWGVMISDGRALIATGWWIALFAGLAVVITVICFNTVGDMLRDRFDPKLREV